MRMYAAVHLFVSAGLEVFGCATAATAIQATTDIELKAVDLPGVVGQRIGAPG